MQLVGVALKTEKAKPPTGTYELELERVELNAPTIDDKLFFAGKKGSSGALGGTVDLAGDTTCEGKKLKLIPPSRRMETIARVMEITILFFCVLIASLPSYFI
jgi:hypothetical protein